MRVEGFNVAGAQAPEAARPESPAPRLSTAQPVAPPRFVQLKAERLEEEQVRRADETRSSVSPVPDSRSRIRVDEASNRLIAQVVNENNQVIKQYPPEAILKFSARFKKLQGVLFDEKA
jgi:uncharacterized FlaG/YvyC family protein